MDCFVGHGAATGAGDCGAADCGDGDWGAVDCGAVDWGAVDWGAVDLGAAGCGGGCDGAWGSALASVLRRLSSLRYSHGCTCF